MCFGIEICYFQISSELQSEKNNTKFLECPLIVELGTGVIEAHQLSIQNSNIYILKYVLVHQLGELWRRL